MIVTSEPKRRKIDANSQPMIPPPRTTSRLRHLGLREQAGRVDAAGRVEPLDRRAQRERAGGDHGVLEGDVLAALDRDRVRVLEAAGALDPLDAVGLEEECHAVCHLLDDAVLPLVGRGQVEGRRADLDAELGEGLVGLLQREARSAPRPWSGCTRCAGRCRRARAPCRCRRSWRRAARCESLLCNRRGRRRGRQHHIPSSLCSSLGFGRDPSGGGSRGAGVGRWCSSGTKRSHTRAFFGVPSKAGAKGRRPPGKGSRVRAC